MTKFKKGVKALGSSETYKRVGAVALGIATTAIIGRLGVKAVPEN
jgi:hypothetical protein